MVTQLKDILSRRCEIYAYIVYNHEVHYEEIMQEFNISSRTLARDIRFISEEIAMLDTKPGKTGGIRVLSDQIPPSVVKLGREDASTIVEMYDFLDGEEMDAMFEQKDRFKETLHRIIRIYAGRDTARKFEEKVSK